jgi:transcriptional regulator with XRE-family HTH domain
MDSKSLLGQKIYKKRINKGLSQFELGEKIGVSHVMISNYESGKKSPQIITLKKLAEVLEVDFNYFFLNNESNENYLTELIKKEGLDFDVSKLTKKDIEELNNDIMFMLKIIKEKFKI